MDHIHHEVEQRYSTQAAEGEHEKGVLMWLYNP